MPEEVEKIKTALEDPFGLIDFGLTDVLASRDSEREHMPDGLLDSNQAERFIDLIVGKPARIVIQPWSTGPQLLPSDLAPHRDSLTKILRSQNQVSQDPHAGLTLREQAHAERWSEDLYKAKRCRRCGNTGCMCPRET